MCGIKKLTGVFILMIALSFSISASEEEKNLLRNGGFEELTGQGAPLGWSSPWPTEGISLSEDVKWSGSYALCITLDDNKKRFCLPQYLPPGTFEPNTTYRLTCYIKTKDVIPDTTNKLYPTYTGAGFQIMVKAGEMNLFCPSPLFTGTIPWTAQQFTFTTPKEISKTQPYFRAILDYATGTVWFDDFRLEKVEKVN